MGKLYLKNPNQIDAYHSPWQLSEAIKIRVWETIWTIFVRWLPKPFSIWYKFLLKLFGCKIKGKPFVAPSCRIYAPWLLQLDDHSCLAPRSEVYNLGPIKIGKRATIAQYTYLCNGTHDFADPCLPLLVGEMEIGDDSFIGAKSIILPGIHVGEMSIVGAGAVVTKDVEPRAVVAGNPAKQIKSRILKNE